MLRVEAEEAAAIIGRTLTALLATSTDHGRPAANLRAACGYINAHCVSLIMTNAIANPFSGCFVLARDAGASLDKMDDVRAQVVNETARSRTAILIRDAAVMLALSVEGEIIANMRFKAREDVEVVLAAMNDSFSTSEEVAADAMDSLTYQALISAHASITHHLVTAERPLPRMLAFVFAAPKPTLVFAYRLYTDASRADELREENKVVHPAFMRPYGQALSN